jgi:beta-lactamase regulating signal transducer with metallopeptidase domain
VTDAVVCLLELTVAASVAVVLVGVLRAPLRRLAGAGAAYGLWLMVPLSTLTVVLPTQPHPFTPAAQSVSAPVRQVMEDVLADAGSSTDGKAVAFAIWAFGVTIMLAVAVARQRAFVRSLGKLSLLPNGTYRSASAVEPMVVGALRPRVVLPADFESRYTRDERALVLAHERAHVQRGDALANAIATGWLCLSWFNPLMHWAIGRFRFDQELACDALVLAATGTARRRYAHALLKTQLAADSVGTAVPAGCHWQSTHPLTQRIAALKRPLPGTMRRWLGTALVCALISSGSYAAWAVRPDLAASEPDPLALPAQMRQVLLTLPPANAITPAFINIGPPVKKPAPRRCKLSRTRARTTA